MRLLFIFSAYFVIGGCSQSYPKKIVKNSDAGEVILTYFENENGKKTGLESLFFEDGELKATTYFENGLKENNATIYYPNGQISSQIHYKKGKPVDKAYYYSWNGNKKRVEYYSENSEFIRAKSYYFNGRLKEEIAYRVATNTVAYSKFFSLHEYQKIIREKSNFVKIRPLKVDQFEVELMHPQFLTYDSVMVFSTEGYKGDSSKKLIVKRKMKFFNHPFIMDIKEEDYYFEYLNYYIQAYPSKSKKPVDYIVHWHKSEPIPYDNIRPIF